MAVTLSYDDATHTARLVLRMVLAPCNALSQLTLKADWGRLISHALSTTFTSVGFDASRGLAGWKANLPYGTTFTVQTRSGMAATPGSTWTAWTAVSNGGTVSSPSARYL